MYNAKIKFLYKTMNWTMCARTIALTQTVHFYETTWIPVHWYYYLQHKNIQDDSDTIRVWYIHHHICKHWLFLELSSCKYLDKVSILLRSLLIIGSKSNKAPDVSSRISATSLWNACTINAFTTKLKTKIEGHNLMKFKKKNPQNLCNRLTKFCLKSRSWFLS